MRPLFPFRSRCFRVSGLTVILCNSLVLSGCALLGVPPAPPEPPPVAVAPALADPQAFEWEQQVLEATGTSETPPQGGGAIPQRSFAARQSAKTAALLDLRHQVREFPINETDLVGTAMDTIIAVQRGVDLAVRRAEVVEEIPRADGTYQVRVRFPLAPVAEVLRQNYITPGEALPELSAGEENGLGPHT